MLIEDNNPDDNYDKTLVSAFTSGLRPNAILGPHIYSTQNGDGPDVQTRIAQMALEICSAKADDVVFAGRGKDLATLLSALATRDCRNKVTIITGNDVTNMRVKPPVGYSLATGVTVEYAGVASPGEWPSGTDGFTRFRQAFTQLFPHVPYDDGTAMIGYDAAFTATSAIRLTTKADPEPAEVIQELGALQGTRKVPGASGVIDFNANYANGHGSNPIGKPVPILRLLPNGAIGFVHLEWPNGHPPAG